MRNRREQITFGELLLTKRLEAKLSRAQLSRQTGISENSLIRYEKAGLEQGGQYPTGPKLAKLCFQLGIPAASALWGCMDAEDYRKYEFGEGHADISDHPAFSQLHDQYEYLQQENSTYREALRFLVTEHDDLDPSYVEEVIVWIKDEVRNLFSTFENFQARMLANGMADIISEAGHVSMANEGSEVFDRRVKKVSSGAQVLIHQNFRGRIKDQLTSALSIIEEQEPINPEATRK